MARLLIKFTKTNGAKFISHLDTMRTMRRAFRRAALPISYSQGFNPHASISVAAPLSLGIESIAEYADIDIDMEMEPDTILSALNDALPLDIKILRVINVTTKMPASMAAVQAARYSIRFDGSYDIKTCDAAIEKILKSSEIMRMKRSKSGEKLVNIRPLIIDISCEKQDNGFTTFTCILKAGSNGSLGADAVSELLKEYTEGIIKGYPFIAREEIYTEVNNSRIPLDRYFSGK